MQANILYVEDDISLAFVTKDNLEHAGFRVHHCADGKTALEDFGAYKFDLCLVDVMLAEIDGFRVARNIRKINQEVPIIFLTAKSMKEDRIQGFELGADDYVCKPYSIEELVLRIKVFLKRSAKGKIQMPDVYKLGIYRFDFQNLRLVYAEKVQSLTLREAEVLRFLLTHKNTLVKRSDMLESVWGENDYFLGRSMDVFISKLRKYLKEDPNLKIENVHGIGFKLSIT